MKITPEELHQLLGPFPESCALEPELIERVAYDDLIREKVSYLVEDGERITAYVFIPRSEKKLPAIFCHHQHQDSDYFGKDEPAGIIGNPDLAYARELAGLGYITIAPDALAYGERKHEEEPVGYNYWQMATRLVQGKTLLAKSIHDVKRGIDYLVSRSDVDETRIGYIGHSYGGRMGIWSAAYDKRIKATVCNCGCITYRYSISEDAGIQMPFIIQGIMEKCDIDDIVKLIEPNNLLISATTDDKWSKGAKEVFDTAVGSFQEGELALKIYEGGHQFTQEMRDNAYEFLGKYLKGNKVEGTLTIAF